MQVYGKASGHAVDDEQARFGQVSFADRIRVCQYGLGTAEVLRQARVHPTGALSVAASTVRA